ENMLPEGSTWLNDNIASWKKFLSNSGYRYDIIADSTIELGQGKNYKMIILPGSKALSDKEIIELKKYVSTGGSLFATSGTASYSDDGKWRGWDFFSEVFGLKFSKGITKDDFTKVHTLRGGLPITANIPAGYPLKVATWDQPISVEVLDPRTTQASFWFNYKMQEGLTRDEIKKNAGIVYGTYGSGRFVWMGFEINSVIGVQEDYIFFDRLFNNCADWLTYKPVIYVRDWPSNYSAAAVIMPNVSKDAQNVNNLLPILRGEKVPATFFIDPSIVKTNPGLIRTVSNYGEVASLTDVGYVSSVTDTMNKLNDFYTQYNTYAGSKNTLEALTGSKIVGNAPYFGIYDQNSVKALISAKYKYVFTDSLIERSVPKTLIRGDSLLVSMTKTGRDDYEVIRDFGLTDPDFQFYTYQEDLDRILFEGGLYTMKMHTEFQCKPENVDVVRKVIDDLKRKGFWITTAKEIENWWARRNYVEVKVNKRGDTRIALTISNPGKLPISSLVLQLDVSEPASNITMSSEIIGTKLARYEYDKTNRVIYIYINDLNSGESRTYYFDYYKPNT
ncbi:MAG: polysaccharide deacetylase family protein, partial [Ignavibacteriaceae bacterium]|nr:polysaccharide deacetylase family protein [Ignavibacteriaceae bacterium]